MISSYGEDPADVNPKAIAAARKALELDPSLAGPHAVLGATQAESEWDFAGGEAEFRKAIALDPSDATTHQWYSEMLVGLPGRTQDAIDEANRAYELDPLSPIVATSRCGAYYHARQFDQAIAIGQKIVAENPTFGRIHNVLGDIYSFEQKYPEAINEYKIDARLENDKFGIDLVNALEAGFQSGGWTEGLHKSIDVALAQRQAGIRNKSYLIAQTYAMAGDKERAFQWLNTAYAEHEGGLSLMCNDPWLDSIRSDPRYAALVRKIGFPQQ